MNTISDSLKDFIARCLVMSGSITKWGSWTFCPFIRYKGIIYHQRELAVADWLTGIAFMYNTNEFIILCVNPTLDYQLYCAINDFTNLNSKFDGTVDSIVKYLEELNSFKNNIFRKTTIVTLSKINANISLSDCQSLSILEKEVLL